MKKKRYFFVFILVHWRMWLAAVCVMCVSILIVFDFLLLFNPSQLSEDSLLVSSSFFGVIACNKIVGFISNKYICFSSLLFWAKYNRKMWKTEAWESAVNNAKVICDVFAHKTSIRTRNNGGSTTKQNNCNRTDWVSIVTDPVCLYTFQAVLLQLVWQTQNHPLAINVMKKEEEVKRQD